MAAIDKILARTPDDTTLIRKREGLIKLEADPEDVEIAYVLMNYHLTQDHIDRAAREAKKVLAKYPKDWLAICVIAHQGLQHLCQDRRIQISYCQFWLECEYHCLRSAGGNGGDGKMVG